MSVEGTPFTITRTTTVGDLATYLQRIGKLHLQIESLATSTSIVLDTSLQIPLSATLTVVKWDEVIRKQLQYGDRTVSLATHLEATVEGVLQHARFVSFLLFILSFFFFFFGKEG